MITKTCVKIAKDDRHDVYTSCFSNLTLCVNVATRCYMAYGGFVGATAVSPKDLKFSFVSKHKPGFSRRLEYFVSVDEFLSKKAYEYRI